MGTDYTIRILIDAELEKVKKYKENIDKRLDAINGVMSTYQKDSEITLLNQNNSAMPIPVSYELGQLIQKALRISELSGGGYDITSGPLIDLWGFGADFRTKVERYIPSSNQIKKAMNKVNYNYIKVNDKKDQMTIVKKSNQIINLSSIAKGYGVDAVGNYLKKSGLTNYMVEIGGEVQTSGVNIKGKRWRIGIRTPSKKNTLLQKVVYMQNESLATSGDYQNYFTKEGIHYSHIIDPRKGKPINHNLVSVSVIYPECAIADAWATAFLVLGLDKGLFLAEKEELAVLFITRDSQGRFKETLTREFENRVISNQHLVGVSKK